MNKPEVLGKYLYVEIPQRNSKIIVDENTKEELQKQLLKHLQRVKIWAIGDACSDKLKNAYENGREVLINPEGLSQAKMVPFDEGGEEPIIRALIMDYHVIHIWP